jgi:seryl-tRNA synthetase
MKTIDYELVGKAIKLYKQLGYEYLEAPWWASHEAVQVTLPKNIAPFVIRKQDYVTQRTMEALLVGSSEQAIIEMMFKHKITPGLYVMAGPCFRNEPVIDELHHLSS